MHAITSAPSAKPIVCMCTHAVTASVNLMLHTHKSIVYIPDSQIDNYEPNKVMEHACYTDSFTFLCKSDWLTEVELTASPCYDCDSTVR